MMERLIDFSLRNRLLMGVMAALVMAAGIYTYPRLPVDAFPDVSPNLVQVFTVTEGLAPEEVEKYVSFPVEVAMMGLPGVEKIRSVSNFGLSVVNIYFQAGRDIYFCRQVVNERLQEAREQIPEGFGGHAYGRSPDVQGRRQRHQQRRHRVRGRTQRSAAPARSSGPGHGFLAVGHEVKSRGKKQ